MNLPDLPLFDVPDWAGPPPAPSLEEYEKWVAEVVANHRKSKYDQHTLDDPNRYPAGERFTL